MQVLKPNSTAQLCPKQRVQKCVCVCVWSLDTGKKEDDQTGEGCRFIKKKLCQGWGGDEGMVWSVVGGGGGGGGGEINPHSIVLASSGHGYSMWSVSCRVFLRLKETNCTGARPHVTVKSFCPWTLACICFMCILCLPYKAQCAPPCQWDTRYRNYHSHYYYHCTDQVFCGKKPVVILINWVNGRIIFESSRDGLVYNFWHLMNVKIWIPMEFLQCIFRTLQHVLKTKSVFFLSSQ